LRPEFGKKRFIVIPKDRIQVPNYKYTSNDSHPGTLFWHGV
jgi:hypothetical protein